MNQSRQRRYDIDWLRVLVILVVFVFHSGRFFDLDDWHVKNGQTYMGVQLWTAFLVSWMMPIIFGISGASTFFALGSRNAGKFVKDRTLRLLVPLLAGIFTHAALQVYLERITHHDYKGSFFGWYPHYFDGLYGFGGNLAWMGMHLWYLEVLFVFSLICLPLFMWLKEERGGRLLRRLGDLLARPGALYLLALPTILLMVLVDPGTTLGRRDFGGWSLLNHIFFFVTGFGLMTHAGLQGSIRRWRWVSLAGGVLSLGTLLWFWAGQGDPQFGTDRYTLVFGIWGLMCWCWMLAILGFGMTHLNVPARFLERANEAVLPFYILHQTVLLCVGYFVVQWHVPDLVKWFIIASSSFVIIVALYEFLIRRFNVLRFLFGMKTIPRQAQPAAPAPASSAAGD